VLLSVSWGVWLRVSVGSMGIPLMGLMGKRFNGALQAGGQGFESPRLHHFPDMIQGPISGTRSPG